MAFTVAAWNLQEGLAISKDYRAPGIADEILKLDKDIVVLSDAYWLGNPLHGASTDVAQTALDILEANDYQAVQTEYGEDHRWSERYLAILSRIPLRRAQAIRLGGRNAIKLALQDPATAVELELVGAHFTDRAESQRLIQVADLLEQVDTLTPAVVAGDLNAMPASSGWAPLLRSRPVRAFVPKLPKRPPFVTNDEQRAGAAPNIGERLADMAMGMTLEALERGGLYSKNYGQRPTMPSTHPRFQLDHILTTEHFGASDFQVHELADRRLSDHCPVSVTLEV